MTTFSIMIHIVAPLVLFGFGCLVGMILESEKREKQKKRRELDEAVRRQMDAFFQQGRRF